MNKMTDSGARDLANAIIFQAVDDYRTGNRGRKSEVARFFNSEWCDMLMPRDLTGRDVKRRINKIELPNKGEW